MNFLIESALLTQGTVALTSDEIRTLWGDAPAHIVWMEEGRLVMDGLEAYLDFRGRALSGSLGKIGRVNHYNMEKAMKEGASAALTASGALSVCSREGIPLAVTAGIGGYFPGQLETDFVPADLATLRDLSVILLSAGPKDMLDLAGTLAFLETVGVRVRSVDDRAYTGYVFCGKEIPLQTFEPEDLSGDGSLFLINQIPEEKRIADDSILEEAIRYGREAEAGGAFYHPAVNAKLDELTDFLSSRLQIEALAANARLAERL